MIKNNTRPRTKNVRPGVFGLPFHKLFHLSSNLLSIHTDIGSVFFISFFFFNNVFSTIYTGSALRFFDEDPPSRAKKVPLPLTGSYRELRRCRPPPKRRGDRSGKGHRSRTSGRTLIIIAPHPGHLMSDMRTGMFFFAFFSVCRFAARGRPGLPSFTFVISSFFSEQFV